MTVKAVAEVERCVSDHDEITWLRNRVDMMEAEIKKMREEAQEREVKRLRWGVMVLGAIVLSMAGWAWAQVEHFISLRVGK